MRFGVTLNPFLDAGTVVAEAQLAERLGYDAVWVADSQLIWRELYTLLGAVAVTTSRVLLGTAVTNPVTRHAAVTASAIVTLQELSQGRMRLGLGVGDSSLKTMGLASVPRQELADYVGTVRTLCQGESVESQHGTMRLAFGNPDRATPFVIAGGGPKMLELAGRIGDGVMLSGAGRADAALAAMLDHVRTGREQAGGRSASFMNVVGCAGAVDDDGQRAKVAVRPHVARGLLTARWERSEATRRASEIVKANYDYNDHMNPHARHAQLVPDEVVPEFAIAGTPDECAEQIRGLAGADIDELTIYPYAVEGRSRADLIEAFARDVVARFR